MLDVLVWIAAAFLVPNPWWFALLGQGSAWTQTADLTGPYLCMPAYLAMELIVGATFGKLAVDLRVVNLHGDRACVRQRTLRWLVKASPWLLVALNYALTPILDRQFLSDFVMREVPYAVSSRVDTMLPEVTRSIWKSLITYPLGSSIEFLAGGWLIGIVLVPGELLVLLPARRTLIDRLSQTRVQRRSAFSAPRGFEVVFRVQFKTPI